MRKVIEEVVLSVREGEDLTHIVIQNGGGNLKLYRVARANMSDYQRLLEQTNDLP